MTATRSLDVYFIISVIGKNYSLCRENHRVINALSVRIPKPHNTYTRGYMDTWSCLESAKTAPWPSRGLHHFGKFLEPVLSPQNWL